MRVGSIRMSVLLFVRLDYCAHVTRAELLDQHPQRIEPRVDKYGVLPDRADVVRDERWQRG